MNLEPEKQTTLSHHPLPAETLREAPLLSCFVHVVSSRCGSLLAVSRSAYVRSADDVISSRYVIVPVLILMHFLNTSGQTHLKGKKVGGGERLACTVFCLIHTAAVVLIVFRAMISMGSR